MTRAAIIALALLSGCGARDDSDPPNGRSGFDVFTDAKTGCQYIGWPRSMWGGAAITPRLGADGKQICNRATAQRTGDL